MKELVYAYAMWISPAFSLKVIRAYDELVTQPVVPVEQPMSNPLAEQLVTVHAGQIAELLSQQTRLIALLEARLVAPAALPAPGSNPSAPARFTVAHWARTNRVELSVSQRRQIEANLVADYTSHGYQVLRSRNGFGLFSATRIEKHVRDADPKQRQFAF